MYGQLYRDYTVAIDYTYDPLERLVRADYSTGIHFAYAFDAVGNRTHLTETTPLSGTIVTTYTYDLADRLLTVTRAGAATAYAWNERGDLLDDGTQAYAWDAAGRLVGVSVADGPEVAYLYDGLNDRIAMVVDGVTTTYVVDPYNPVDYLPQVLVEEVGGAATRNFYGLDLLAQAGSTTTTHLAYDALSVRLRLDEDGAPADAYRYGPFGEAMGEAPIGYGFAGERWDEPVGLVYLRARYYAPEMGRFVSRDPQPEEMQRPTTLNRYIYATNQPNVLVDPGGKEPLWPTFPLVPSLMDLLVSGQLDMEDVTPSFLKARWPSIKLMNADWKYGCLANPDAYHWPPSELYDKVTTLYLHPLSWDVNRIGEIWQSDALLNAMVGGPSYSWRILRSLPDAPGGKRGGQTVDAPYPSSYTVFFGWPRWAKLGLTQAQDIFNHEFGHVWDSSFEYSWSYRLSKYLPDSPGNAEAWAIAFADAIRDRITGRNAEYAREKIRVAPYLSGLK